MVMQSFNLLIKSAKKILKDSETYIPVVFKYLKMIKDIDGMKCKATEEKDFLDLDVVMEAMQVQICFRLRRILQKM